MSEPLAIGTRVRVIIPPALEGDEATLSEPTSIGAVQFVTDDGEIVDEPQARWQYLLDGEEPFADTAFRPELLEVVE